MNEMIKKLMVVLVAALMFFTSALTPVRAESEFEDPTALPAEELSDNSSTVTADEPETKEPAAEPAEQSDSVSEDQNDGSDGDVLVNAETSDVSLSDDSTVNISVDELVGELTADYVAEETPAAMLYTPLRSENETSVNAGKSVTDTDGNGIYELELSVNAKSEQSTHADVTKSNVVMVIDVSGSMGFDAFTKVTDTSTYDANKRYYSSTSVNSNNAANGTRVYYDGSRWYYNSWGRTYDYNGDVYLAETRLESTKAAACAVVDELLKYNINDDEISDIFEVTVIKFANKTEDTDRWGNINENGTKTIIKDSTDSTAIKNAINGLAATGGTNWQAALEQALAEANYFKNEASNENTSVIFLTDGFPTFYGNDQGYSNQQAGQEYDQNIATCYSNSRNAARNIVSNGYTLYNIFAFGSDTNTHNGHTGYEYLRALTNYAYGSDNDDNFGATTETNAYCYNAKSTDQLVAAFNTIIDHITNNVGYAGVNVTDGVSMGATSTSIAVANGEAKPETMRYAVLDDSGKLSYEVKFASNGAATFTIYNADETKTTETVNTPKTVETTINGTTITSKVYSVTVGTGDDAKTYEMSPATVDADTGMVKWDLAGLGILKSGYTYKVAFDVWPNQTAYDIAADLNNGIYKNIDEALAAYEVPDADKERIKAAIHQNEESGAYELFTNYTQQVEYYPAESKTNDSGETTWTYGEKTTQDIKPPKPIPLKGSKIDLTKAWEAGLDEAQLNEVLWENGVVDGTPTKYQLTLNIWKADTENELNEMISKGVTDTNKPYITKVLGWDEEAGKYIFTKSAAVAPGMMVKVADAAALGYDTSDETRLKKFKNDNGDTITYYVIEDGHYYYVTEDGGDLHFELNTVLYHPMIVDGDLYNVGFASDGTVEKMDSMNAIVATNTLKGRLNIAKIVSSTEIAVKDGKIENLTVDVDDNGIKTVDDEFAFEIKIWKEDSTGAKTAVYTTDDQIDKEKQETKSGSIGYRVLSEPYADGEEVKYKTTVKGAILSEDSQYKDLANGNFATVTKEETTIKLVMPANGEIRLVNLPAGTKYSVTEITDTTGNYTFAAINSQVKSGTGLNEGTVGTSKTVTGSISGNKASVETYYNWAGSFYVYHSSDNTIEKISFADDRVKGTYADSEYVYSFNIAYETKIGSLYGGYYKSYTDQAMSDQEIINADYSLKDGSIELEYTAAHKGGYWTTDTEGAKPYDGKEAPKWNKDFYSESGLSANVKHDTVYYLKEVPDTRYLQSYTHFTYYKYEPYNIPNMWMISDIDDVNYIQTGFIITKDNKANVCVSLKVQNAVGGAAVKLTPNKVFKAQGATNNNYLTYLPVVGNGSVDPVSDGSKITQYWVTPDNVKVTGTVERTLNGVGNKTTLTKKDKTISSTAEEFTNTVSEAGQ